MSHDIHPFPLSLHVWASGAIEVNLGPAPAGAIELARLTAEAAIDLAGQMDGHGVIDTRYFHDIGLRPTIPQVADADDADAAIDALIHFGWELIEIAGKITGIAWCGNSGQFQ